jgi:hypothetical protein
MLAATHYREEIFGGPTMEYIDVSGMAGVNSLTMYMIAGDYSFRR